MPDRPFTNAAGNPDRWPPAPVRAESLDHAIVEIVRGHDVVCPPAMYERLHEMGEDGIQARYDEIKQLIRERFDECD